MFKWLRKVLAPGRTGVEEAWRAWAEARGGTYEEPGNPGPRVRVREGNWPLILDVTVLNTGSSSFKVTRMRLAVRMPRPTSIRVYPEDAFAKLGKLFGGQDVVVGLRSFDDAFVVKADEPGLARALLGTGATGGRLTAIPDLLLYLLPIGRKGSELAVWMAKLPRLSREPEELDHLAAGLGALADRLVSLERATDEALRID